MGSARSFHLGDILSATTGALVSPTHMDGVQRILSFMVGEDLFTHQLPRAVDECKPALLEQHPDLAAVVFPDTVAHTEVEVEAWLAQQVALFGEYRDVLPLRPEDHTHINPFVELRTMAPQADLLVIEVDP